MNRLTISLFSLLLLSGCAPSVHQLRPVSGDVAQFDGRPVTKSEQSGIVVVASFERLDMQYVALDIEVKNQTDRPIEVNPADFHYAALNENQDSLRNRINPVYGLVYSAADPQREARLVTVKQAQEEKRLRTARIINTVLLVAAVASDVASSTSARNTRDYGRWVNNRVAHNNMYQMVAMKRAIDHGTFANRMQRYEYETYRWKELALRRTTVPPGESVRGLVYLPLYKDAHYLKLGFPVPENEPVSILFRQEQVKPDRRR